MSPPAWPVRENSPSKNGWAANNNGIPQLRKKLERNVSPRSERRYASGDRAPLALQFHWEPRSGSLGFPPWELGVFLARLLGLSRMRGIGLSLRKAK